MENKNPLKATELKNLGVLFDEATEAIVFLRSCKKDQREWKIANCSNVKLYYAS
jgi:hypothetical protein